MDTPSLSSSNSTIDISPPDSGATGNVLFYQCTASNRTQPGKSYRTRALNGRSIFKNRIGPENAARQVPNFQPYILNTSEGAPCGINKKTNSQPGNNRNQSATARPRPSRPLRQARRRR